MTRRDGDATVKIASMDQQDQGRKNYSFRTENASPPPASSKPRNDRDVPRSASNSLPGSRASSRPGSRMASRTNSQESIIDLFDCMTLTYGRNGPEGKGFQLISPKPRLLPNRQWTWADKLRINSAIWRSWHIQFVKGRKPIGCHFDPRLPESRPTLQADAIQSGRGTIGSIQYNQSQVGSVVRDYRRWRLYHMDTSKPLMTQPQPEPVENPEDNAIDLDMPHPPLSPMAARTLLNDDTLKNFSDTLFISKKKHFSVPHPKKIARHVYNADILQPGLMQLEPDFDDDFMETLDSLQDVLCKTPTKVDLRSLIEFPESFMNSDSVSSFNESLLLGPLTTVSEETSESQPSPVFVTERGTPYPVAISSNPSNIARSLSFPSSTPSPLTVTASSSSSAQQIWSQGLYGIPMNQSQTTGHLSSHCPTSTIMTSGTGFSQMPPILEVAGSGVGVMAMQIDSTPTQIKSSVRTSTGSQVSSTKITKREPYSPPMTTSSHTMNPGVDINDAIDILSAQLQQQQQQLQQQKQQQQKHLQQLQGSEPRVAASNWQHSQQYQTVAVSGSNSNWPIGSTKGNAQTSSNSYSLEMDSNTSWPYSNLPLSVPSSGMNWSLAGSTSDPSIIAGGIPYGIMSQGGLSSSNVAFIQNAGGYPQDMITDAISPMDQNILLAAAYSPPTNAPSSSGHVTPGHVTTPGHATSGQLTPGHVTPGHVTPGHVTPGRRTSGHVTPGHVTPGHVTPGHITPGHVTPGHVTPGFVTPGHATPGHVTPGHVTPGHVTPGHVTPGHVTPGHVTPGHVTPGHVTPGHVTPGHVTPGHVTPGHVTPGYVTPQLDESMDFEQFQFPAIQIPANTATSSYKIKRERSHSRKNSNDHSPRVGHVAFADHATSAGFMGKSEAKELGMPCPSEMSVNPLLSSSGHPPNVSSAASSPGSLTEGTEFEFSTPHAKRRKTPDSNGEKETRRRYKHLQSEHKRRFNIQSGLDEIQSMVPSLQNTSDSSKISTATMLQKAHEHIVNLREDLRDLRNNAETLKEEIQDLNKEIDSCQDELPDSGAPVNTQKDSMLRHMMDSYVNEKMKQNWTFWIFSLIIRPLFETYLSAVSSSHISDFDQTVREWTEEHCRLKPLRKLVTSALTKVSRETSVLMDPASLRVQVQDIISKCPNDLKIPSKT